MKKFKPYIEVTVSYKGKANSIFEYKASSIAEEFKGISGNSKYVNNVRTLSFRFFNLINARGFFNRINRFTKIKPTIKSTSHINPKD